MTDAPAADARSKAGAFDRPPLLLFRSGFRVFFLMAGLHAAVAMALWSAWLMVPVGGALGPAVNPVGWHAHEMLFGYAVAAAAGFLLTAVPHWAGTTAARGRTVLVLAVLWLLGRIAMWLAGVLPAWLVALADLAFLPALIGVLAVALLPVRNKRNHIFLVLLAVWWLCSLLDHLDFMGLEATGTYARRLATDVLAVMMVIIGGRITPSFTRNWLKAQGKPDTVHTDVFLERTAVGLAVLLLILHALTVWDWLIGATALLTGVAVLGRLVRWSGLSTLGEPILFVLHLGYAWVGVAFLLEAGALLFDWLPYTTAWHAMTVGAVGTLTLAVMTRAALGHSGRPITADTLTMTAYALVTMAAIVRVFGPLLKPEGYASLVVASGVLWSLAFLCFVVAYWHPLTRPRADGKPG